MTPRELREKWSARCDEWERFNARVDGAKVVREVLADITAVETQHGEDELTLKQAACVSGYSPRQLRRLVNAGQIPNRGKRNAPRLSRKDLPSKPRTETNTGEHHPTDSTLLSIARGAVAGKSNRRGCA